MKSGIYQIRNTKNGHCYFGSSKDIPKRFKTHLRDLRKNKHHSRYLQNAWNKYGENSFEFQVLLFCSGEDLLNAEQALIVCFDPEYNISKSAYSPMTGRKHSEATLEKFRKRTPPSGKDSPIYGTKWSEQMRKKILTSRLGFKHSQETKEKMRATSIRLNRAGDLLGSRNKAIVDSNGNVFDSATDAAAFWKVSRQTVCDILKGRHYQTRKKISFKYA